MPLVEQIRVLLLEADQSVPKLRELSLIVFFYLIQLLEANDASIAFTDLRNDTWTAETEVKLFLARMGVHVCRRKTIGEHIVAHDLDNPVKRCIFDCVVISLLSISPVSGNWRIVRRVECPAACCSHKEEIINYTN